MLTVCSVELQTCIALSGVSVRTHRLHCGSFQAEWRRTINLQAKHHTAGSRSGREHAVSAELRYDTSLSSPAIPMFLAGYTVLNVLC